MVGVLKSISSANPYRNVQVWPSARVVDSVLWGINLPLIDPVNPPRRRPF